MQVGSVARKEYTYIHSSNQFFSWFFLISCQNDAKKSVICTQQLNLSLICHSNFSSKILYSLYLPIYELSSSCNIISFFFLLKSSLTSSSFFCKVERVIVVVVNIIIFSLFWRKNDPIYCTIYVMELFEKKGHNFN